MVGDGAKLRLAEAIRSSVFFGLLYLCLWRVVEPQLIYGCATITNFPVFYQGGPFLRDCLSCPGGVLRYVNALLPQFFYYPWAGALVITAQAGALWACTGWFLRALAVPGWRLLRFVPALIVVVPYARYSYHFPTITGALASLLFACLYVSGSSGVRRLRRSFRLPWGVLRNEPRNRSTLDDVIAYLVLAVVAYVVSAGAFLPFALLCAIYELLHRRRHVVGFVYLLLAAVLPYAVGVLVFHVSSVSAYTDMLPLSWQLRGWATRRKMIGAVYVLYLFPMAVALLGALGRVIVTWWTAHQTEVQVHPEKKPGSPGAKPRLFRLRRAAVRWTLESALLFALGAAVVVLSLDRSQKALLTVHYYACQRQWPQVLRVSRSCMDKYAVMNAVNRALYYTGRLDQDMFTWLQRPDALVYTGQDHALFYWHKLDTLLDLGLLNLAEKNFTECMEMFGEQPMILQRLALVNLAKGKIEAGRIYLEKLRQTLFFGGWARDYLDRLAADPTLAGDPQMQQLRAHALRKDFTAGFYAPEQVLSALVEQGSGNRMAFEYLMAWYMIEKRLDKFVQNLPRLQDFGYTAVPPLYQEAALIYGTRHPIPAAAVSPEAQQRIKQFSDIFNRYGRNKEAAFRELASKYAGSYLFYFIYAASPARP